MSMKACVKTACSGLNLFNLSCLAEVGCDACASNLVRTDELTVESTPTVARCTANARRARTNCDVLNSAIR